MTIHIHIHDDPSAPALRSGPAPTVTHRTIDGAVAEVAVGVKGSVPTPCRYENDTSLTTWAKTLARDCAAKSDHPYAKEAENDLKWNAHPWVIEAIKQAYQAGQVDADAKALLVQETMTEQHDTLNTSLVRATIAGVLEAVGNDLVVEHTSDTQRGNHVFCVSTVMNLDAQRTVWDRWDYETTRTEDGKAVELTIVRK